MTTENIDIKVREDGSREVKRKIQDIGDTARKAGDGVDYLKRFLGAIGTYLAVSKVVQYADAWSAAAGQIKIATKSTEEAVAVTNALFKAAQNTRQPFEDLVTLYSRAARAGKELGASQERLITFSENIGKALSVQGTSSEAAKGALLQLGQAIGGGVVRAEEFNSILEGAPYILQVVANNLKGAGGSVSQLRKIMIDGKLTSKDFFEAFEKGGKDIEKDFQKAPLTIKQGLQTIENALIKFIGETDKALGISEKFGMAAKFIADNFDQCVTILLSFAAAAAVAFAPGLIASFAGAVKGLFTLIAAHPFGALLAALAGAAVYLYKFRDSLDIGLDGITTFGDLLRALGEIAVQVFDTLKYAAIGFFSDFSNWAQSAYAEVTGATDEGVKNWLSSFGDFYSDVGSGFAGVVRGIAKTIDAIAGLITGLVIGAGRILGGIPEAVAIPFKMAYNFAAEQIEKIVNTLIEGVNKVRSIIGKDMIETISIPRAEVDEDYYRKYGQSIGESIYDGFESQGQFMLKSVDGVFKRAAELAKMRKISEGMTMGKPDLSQGGAGGNKPAIDPKEVEKATRAYESLLASLNPVWAAEIEMKQAHKTLDDARKNGLITMQRQIELQSLVNEKYQDALDPIGAWNREMDVQYKLSSMSARASEIESQFIQVRNEMLAKGVKVDQDAERAIRGRLLAMQNLKDQMVVEDQLIANSVEARRGFTTQLVAIQSLLNKDSGFTEGDAAQAKNALLQNAGIDTEGTKTAMDANVEQFRLMYAQIDELRKHNLIGEQEAAALTAKVWAKEQNMRFKSANDFFTQLAELQSSKSKTMSRIGKAAAIAQATIKTYESATSAYSAMAGIPYVGPALGAAAAAAAVAAGLANVQAIKSAPGFKEGGWTGNGGVNDIAGVVHSREFVMDAENTAKNRPALEAMHNGADFRDMIGNAGGIKIKIDNYGTGKEFEVQQITRDEVRIIARDEARKVTPEVVASEFNNPNSRVSAAAQRNLQGGGRKR